MFDESVGRCAQQHQGQLKKQASDDKLATKQKKGWGRIPGIKVHYKVWEKSRPWLEYNVEWEGGDDSKKAPMP